MKKENIPGAGGVSCLRPPLNVIIKNPPIEGGHAMCDGDGGGGVDSGGRHHL